MVKWSGVVKKLNIFDSNVWINGLAEDVPEATQLIQETVDQERVVGVSAYICEEVNRNIQYEYGSGEYTDDLLSTFNKLLSASNVISPGLREISKMDTTEVRNSQSALFVGRILGVQPKDAPIVRFAWEHRGEQPRIFSTDESFAELDPADYDLEEISMEYIDPN